MPNLLAGWIKFFNGEDLWNIFFYHAEEIVEMLTKNEKYYWMKEFVLSEKQLF